LGQRSQRVGRQFQSYGLGLLVNNSRQSQQGIRLGWNDIFKTGLGLEGFVGGASYTFGDFEEEEPGDGYVSLRLAYAQPSFKLAGNWLVDGAGDETGWGVDGWARFWGGREIQAEFGTLTQAIDGSDYSHNDPIGVMGSVDIWKGNNWALKGFYSQADAEYNPMYSTLNPYFEAYGNSDNGRAWLNWGRWLDNPLVIPNLRAIGGNLDFSFAKADFQAMYYNLDNLSEFWGMTRWGGSSGLNPDGVPYNQLWGVRMKKEIANGVNLNLTYARQMVDKDVLVVGDNSLGDLGYDDAQLLMAGVAVGF